MLVEIETHIKFSGDLEHIELTMDQAKALVAYVRAAEAWANRRNTIHPRGELELWEELRLARRALGLD